MSCAQYDPHAPTFKKGDYIKKKKSMELVKPVDLAWVRIYAKLSFIIFVAFYYI